MKLPQLRNKNIVIQEIRNEIMIYDLEINKAYCLNEISAIVYQNCDGKTDFAELKAKSNFPNEIIYLALDQLKKENLLEKDTTFLSPFNGLSRREIIKKIGLSSMIALPLISSVIAPTAINAQSNSCAPGLVAPGMASLICTGGIGDCAAFNGCGPTGIPGFDAPAACCSGMATIAPCTALPIGESCPCICSA